MNRTFLSRVISRPWAIRSEDLALFTQHIISPLAPQLFARAPRTPLAALGRPEPGKYIAFSYAAAEAQSLPVPSPGIYILQLWGILGRCWSDFEKDYLDAIDVDDVMAALDSIPLTATVILWFRSPGGLVTGIPEAAQYLAARVAAGGRLLAFTDDLCASAAYWLASQCTAIIATPTADVGSIGVRLSFYDWCDYLAKAGIKLELFEAGTMKTIGLPGDPLNDQERDYLTASVQESNRQFRDSVLSKRLLAEETMQGQTYNGANAKAKNLVDAFAPSASTYFAAVR